MDNARTIAQAAERLPQHTDRLHLLVNATRVLYGAGFAPA